MQSQNWEDKINQLACDMFDREFEIIPEKRQKFIDFISSLLKSQEEKLIREIHEKAVEKYTENPNEEDYYINVGIAVTVGVITNLAKERGVDLNKS
jgi:hypothetical protein